MSSDNGVVLDCDAGRRLGCGSFCCQLIVRLTEDEEKHFCKRMLDKDAQGYCEFFDKQDGMCRVWATRPEVCRGYDCNSDMLLQVALREGFRSLLELATSHPFIRKHEMRYIPYVELRGPDPDDHNGSA